MALPLVGELVESRAAASSALSLTLTSAVTGSFHGSDILNVFGLSPLNPTTEMQTRWIAFANTMNRESLPSLRRAGRLTRYLR